MPEIYSYVRKVSPISYHPIHNHLCIEYGTYLYFVPYENTLTIRKMNTTDGTSVVITTETGSITKFYFDQTNDKLYFVHNLNIVAYIDLTDDSVSSDYTTTTDDPGTLSAIEDLIVYGSDIFVIDVLADDLTFYKYDSLNTEWDNVGTVAEGDNNYYDINTLSAGANVNLYGICSDGTHFYIVDNVDDTVYKYDSDFALVGSYNIGALGGNDDPKHICYESSYFYVTDGDQSVYKYPSDFSVLTTSYNLNALGIGIPNGIASDGTYFYIVRAVDNEVYKLPSDFSEILETFDMSSSMASSQYICYDGEFFYLHDGTFNHIKKFPSDFSVVLATYDIASLTNNDNPVGIWFDGDYFYVTDFADVYVYQYLPDFETGSILFNVLISDKCYVIYQYVTGDCKLYIKDLDDSNNPTLLKTFTSGLAIPYLEDQKGIAYDNSDILYFIMKDISDGLTYLCTYEISTDTFTNTGLEYNIALMLNRNTNSSATPECFALEKGFGLTTGANGNALKVYIISRTRGAMNFLGQFYATYPTGTYPSARIRAITDNFMIIYDGTNYYLWQYQDIMATQIAKCEIHAKKRTWYSIELQWLELGTGYQDPPVRDQFIQVFGRYSSYTLGGSYYEDNHIIAEGLVRTHDLKLTRNVSVVSLAKEELQNIAPNISDYTNYTGKTSGQIIDQLIDDYCKTIQVGTIANGSTTWTCPDDWKAQGDKSLEQIFNELADTEEFQWYLRPDNSLDFNDGTVDSQRTFATTDVYSNPEARQLSQNINQVELMGGFVDGTQIGPVTADDLEHQQLYGNIVKWSKTYASVLDATILQTIADAKLNLQGSAPLVYWATRRVSTDWGFIQVGELITMQAVKVDPDSNQTLTTGSYILDENTYDAKEGESDLKLTDGLLFQEDASMNLSEQNSQLIQQTASTLREIARPNTTSLSPDHTGEGCIVTLTAGENLVFGEVCYFKSDGKCWKADSSATTTMPVSFMALESITADNTGSFLLWGTIRDDSWNWTVGGLIYISSTAGSLTQTAPAGEEIQVCGIALSADIMLFFLNFQYSSDVVFASSWNSLYQAPTKNSIYDAFKAQGSENVCRIATGTYTGNSSGASRVDNRQITGLGFDPIAVICFEDSSPDLFRMKTQDMSQWNSFYVYDGATGQDDNTIDLITDGFEVNNNNANHEWNKDAAVYYYIAYG